MIVRRARSDDFDAVTALLELLGRPRVPRRGRARDRCRDLFERQMSDPDSRHLVAEDDTGAVVGFCSLHFRERLNYTTPQAWVPDLIVAGEARGRGVGLALLEGAELQARKRGCSRIALESGYSRAEAHRLYLRVGMEDAGKFFQKQL